MGRTLRASTSKKRRLTIAAIVALGVAVVAPMVAPSAGAVIDNAGNVTVSLHLSVFTPTFTVAGMSTMGSGNALVEANGLVKIPESSLSFQPVDVQVNLPDSSGATAPAVVTVQAVATSDFDGGLDPISGAAFVTGNIELLWSSAPTMSNCPVGPFRITTRTNAQGAIPYSSDTGTVSMVDPGFTVDAIPSATSGCGGFESALNSALSLPVTTTTTTTSPIQAPPTTAINPYSGPPVPAVVLSVTFSPAPHASAPPPTQPRPRPTTTAAPPPTTAAAPPTTSFVQLPPPTLPPTVGGGAGQAPDRQHFKAVSKKQRHPASRPTRRAALNPRTRRIRLRKRPARHVANPAGSGTANSGGGYLTGHKAKKTVRGARQLSFVPASFVKRSSSALATGLNLAGLLGLLVFSSLALWLVTSELSDFKAGARRQRMHRIAGITDSR
ncbi:MAG TPA: hypothetical protein VK771_06310 [Acidimicrobiia bacterium]|nr:hypothetical protein [Acidimicrobiia bacterium]